MGAQLRAVRARIRAVKSISKITRAQELIASSRIVKAQQRMRTAAPYARELTQAVEAVGSRSATLNHPMVMGAARISRAAALILTSDGGFCGAYNSNVLREASRLRQRNSEAAVATDTYVAGRKGIGWHRFREIPLASEWSGFSAAPSYAKAEEIAVALLDAYDKPTGEGGAAEPYPVSTEVAPTLTPPPAAPR